MWITAISLWLRIGNNKSKSEPFTCYDKVVRIIRLWWAEVEDWLRQSVVGDKLCEWHKFSNSRILARTTDNTVFLQDTYIPQNSTSFEVLFCGGQRWIRTTEVEDVRFTV